MLAVNLVPVQAKSGGNVYVQYVYEKKNVFYDLFEADDYDRSHFEPNPGCVLFRVSDNLRLSAPIVCINLEKNLMYFLTNYGDEETKPKFEKKGLKILFTKPLSEIISNVEKYSGK